MHFAVLSHCAWCVASSLGTVPFLIVYKTPGCLQRVDLVYTSARSAALRNPLCGIVYDRPSCLKHASVSVQSQLPVLIPYTCMVAAITAPR